MNKMMIMSAFLALTLQTSAANDSKPTFTEWHDLQVNEVNRFPLHTAFFAYEGENLALQGDKTKSANYLTLDGQWKFNWVANADQRPTDFYTLNYDDSAWKNMWVTGYLGTQRIWRPRLQKRRLRLVRPFQGQPAAGSRQRQPWGTYRRPHHNSPTAGQGAR